jgi:hypothetical protein
MNQFFVLIVHFHVNKNHKKIFLFYNVLHFLIIDYILFQAVYMLLEVHRNVEPKDKNKFFLFKLIRRIFFLYSSPSLTDR